MSEGFVLVHMHIESEKDNLVDSHQKSGRQKWLSCTVVGISSIRRYLLHDGRCLRSAVQGPGEVQSPATLRHLPSRILHCIRSQSWCLCLQYHFHKYIILAAT